MAFKQIRLALTAAAVAASGAAVADTVKIGVVAPFSGPFARWGEQFQQAVDVYQAQNGTSVNGDEVEFIYRDSGGPNPDQAKALAQELVVKDEVDFLAGFVFTPNALAAAPISERGQVPTVIFNAATSIINTKSQYFVRSSMTLPQITVPAANYAKSQGYTKVITAVTDYGPGHDAETTFVKTFEDIGGEIVETIRMPLGATDFAPFIQRIKDSGAEAVFTFLPAGPPTFAFTKSYNENGLREAGIDFIGSGETDETTLDALGDQALGLVTAYHYSGAHDSDLNRDFTAKLEEMFPGAVANQASVGAYDGTHILYQMIAAEGDGLAKVEAVKGLAWESPRGPVSIDPRTRHITQNVYMRRVAKDENGKLINEEFDIIADQPDWGYPPE